MELTGLLPIIRRWLLVIVAATAMAAVVGFVLGANVAKTYEAKTRLLVGPLSTDTNTMRASGDLAQTYAELATTTKVLGAVSTDVGVRKGELNNGVRATANSTTRLLTIRARSHDGKTAAEVANSVSAQLIALGGEDPTRPEGELRVIDAATAPSTALSPRLDLIVPLAAIAGLLGSMALILLFEFIGDTAESAEKVQTATGLTTLAIKRHRQRPSGPADERSDQVRLIATQAELAAPDVRCILICGVARDDGTAALTIELADVLGDRRRSVTLIDAGAQEITKLIGADEPRGLADMIADGDTSHGMVQRSDQVSVITSVSAARAEAIELEQAQHLIQELAGADGLVVVHGLSATLSAATLVWAQAADVTILVARRIQARRTAIADTALNLRAVGARLAFAVLHEAPRPARIRSGPSGTGFSGPAPSDPDTEVDPMADRVSSDPFRTRFPSTKQPTEQTTAQGAKKSTSQTTRRATNQQRKKVTKKPQSKARPVTTTRSAS